MSIWNIEDIKLALGDIIVSDVQISDIEIDLVEIDSRRVKDNSIFICITGDNNDGHNFIDQALDNGAKLILASNISDKFANDIRIIHVKDGFLALKKMALFARTRSEAKIIAITGSSGKTTTKDICNFILSQKYRCYSTFDNFNNHFGVPITLVNMPKDIDFAIIEIGMNHVGEISVLTKMINPDIAVITTVNSAHIGNFSSENEIALAKSEIFLGVKEGGHAIINRDNAHYELLKNEAIKSGIDENNVISFGTASTSDIRLDSIENVTHSLFQNYFSSKISVSFVKDRENICFEINSINHVIIDNSMAVVAILKILNIYVADSLKFFSQIELRNGRGNIIKVSKDKVNFTIIDDSYNANPESVVAAIRYLDDIKYTNQNNRIFIILGDMFELGDVAIEEHKKIANYLINSKIDKIYLVGELMKNIKDINTDLDKKIQYFDNSEEVADNIDSFINNGDIILVKGSRGMRMENIINQII